MVIGRKMAEESHLRWCCGHLIPVQRVWFACVVGEEAAYLDDSACRVSHVRVRIYWGYDRFPFPAD